MKKSFFRSKLFVVLIFIILFLSGLMLSVSIGGGTMPHKQLVGIVMTPVETFFSKVGNGISGFFSSFSGYSELEKENGELKSKINDLQTRLNDVLYLEQENEQLREILGVKEENPDFEFAFADVVSRSDDGYGGKLTINAGTNAGIKNKNIVITGEGLVGMVTDVGLNWATVTTILDPQMAVGAAVSSTMDMGMIEGSADLKAEGLCRLSYMDVSAVVTRGDIVETSGLGGTFPKNLTIGTITDIVSETQGLSMYAKVKPAVDMSSVKMVYIITNFDNTGVLDED